MNVLFFYYPVLIGRATPKSKPPSQKPCSAARKARYENVFVKKHLCVVFF